MQATIYLFRHLYKNLPPLFSAETKDKMLAALTRLESDPAISLEDVENTMIAFGYEVWPWNQAWREFLDTAETQVGEHFLLPKLPLPLQNKYLDFKHFGGTLHDLHTGSAADFFTPDERVALCQALVDMQTELREYVSQEIFGLGRERYLQRVDEFSELLNNIQKMLNNLRMLAHTEEDFPTLASEIMARVRSFEYGLCYLGPEPDYGAVCQSIDFFQSRREHLNRSRGIHIPAQVDFFAE